MRALDFVESMAFRRACQDFRFDDDELQQLQRLILSHPSGPPVVRGTGGLRKLRFRLRKSTKGKSGGYRVCYVYFEKHELVLLLTMYAKGDQADLSADDRKFFRTMINEQEKDLALREARPKES